MGGARERSRGKRGEGVALAQEKGNCKVRSRWELVCDRIVFKIPQYEDNSEHLSFAPRSNRN